MQRQIIFLFILFFAGCSTKTIIVDKQDYQNRYKPVIGTRNNDARTAIDFGIVQKIWIAPYKTSNGSLIGSHDIYIWIKRPDFIPGSAIPSSKIRKGVPTETDTLPFTLHSGEIEYKGNLKDDKAISDFVNYENKNTTKSIMKRVREQEEKINKSMTKEKTK